MIDSTEQALVTAFAGKRVLLVGDVMLDEYVWGKVRRISPEAPVPVLDFTHRTCQPGGAANAAANVHSLGGIPLLAGAVGNDPQGTQLLHLLRGAGLETQGLVVVEDRWTTTKTRLIAHSQQVVRVDYERPDPLPAGAEDELLAWVEGELSQADACVLSDYLKGVLSPRVAEHVIALARRHGKPVLVDPKGSSFAKYRGATLVKPNLHEVERVLHREIRDDSDLGDAGSRLLELLESSAVLITRGAEGMTLFRPDAAPVHFPSTARAVFDVTGAGDTVAGTLALALACGAALEPAARLANRAAGIVVGKVGTAQVTWKELLGEGLMS
jgi:D-beta-D-heptose 7-phosphate kinase/D-beta-D-heptose 1-phosphate adenosyltransferase